MPAFSDINSDLSNQNTKIEKVSSDLSKNTTSIRNIDKQLDNGRVAFKWNDTAGLEVRIDGTYMGRVTIG